MGSTEFLPIVTPLTPKEVVETFLSSMDVKQYPPIETVTPAEGYTRAWTDTDLFSIDASTVMGHHIEVSKSLFGFIATVELGFNVSRDANLYDLRYELIKAVSILLQKEAGDLALSFYDPSNMTLRRLNGKLVLNNAHDEIWTPERLVMITVPYTIEPIRVGGG